MTTTTTVTEVRINGLRPRRPPAAAPDARVALIDAVLADLDEGPVFLEIKHGTRSWSEWENNRDYREFLRVGFAGQWGAAEYVRGPRVVNGCVDIGPDRPWTVYRTANPSAPRTDLPRVKDDGCVPTFFPSSAVVPVEQIRDVMIEFALHGALSSRVQWREL